VLITTDSVLHALHHSYDTILAEIETNLVFRTLGALLKDCHEALATLEREGGPVPAESLRDVDLYLTIARNLLAGAGGPARRGAPRRPRRGGDRLRLLGRQVAGPVPTRAGPGGARPAEGHPVPGRPDHRDDPADLDLRRPALRGLLAVSAARPLHQEPRAEAA